jgi:hypothetical protein
MEKTGGKILWMTSADYPAPTEEMKAAAGKDEKLARRYKAERGHKFVDMVAGAGGHVISHMMVHKPNTDLIEEVYQEVIGRGGMFSLGTAQVSAHMFQGRLPSDFTTGLSAEDAQILDNQITRLVLAEDDRLKKGDPRTLANSRAHLMTTKSVGIRQDIGCNDEKIGPPGVFAVMPDGSMRGCPVIMNQEQICKCPGCAYAVFRDGDPRWARYLQESGEYQSADGKIDFPSLFYPNADNNYFQGQFYNV